ncbi:fibronectin type III domain-containing protein [Micromonospora citrea]|uniref:fibronectin type III domain-containing protein n=1 Tax=Micromonospora citrea TaxID=47855 RepID=UPI003C6864A9
MLVAALAVGLIGPTGALPTVGAATAQAAAQPAKIMIAGDSISHGSSGDWTWRYRLWKHFVANGITADLVGPRNDLENIMTAEAGDADHTYADPSFDQDHNANWGRQLREAAAEIRDDVAQYDPSTLLVLLGINDLGWHGRSAEEVEVDLRAFIANARSGRADVRIVLGKLLPTKRAIDEPVFADKVAAYNDRLASVAAELTTATSPIVVADTPNGFVAADHTWDGVHPNSRGELRIAAAFADTLSSAFGIGASYARPFPEVPIGPQDAPDVTVVPTGATTADLSWTPSLGATQYWVWTKDNILNKEWKRLPIPLTQEYNPWHMTDLLAGNTYHYKVQAAKGDDEGAISTEVTLPVGGPVPAAATSLTATAGDGNAVLSWTGGENATSYKIQMRNVTAGQAFEELPYPISETTWTAGLLQNGATYEFKVKSLNGLIEGGLTAAVTVRPTGPPPTAPANLSVTNGAGEATLTWVSDVNATGHEVYMRDVTSGESDFTKLPHVVLGERWVAGLLVNGATYEFKLRAMNGLIPGSFSPVVTARPSVPTPSAATNLTAAAGNGQATLSWTAGLHAAGYYVEQRNVTLNESFSRLPYAVSGTTWTAEELVNGATYEYRLVSTNGLIMGATSAAVRVTPTVAPPPAPTGLTATAGDHRARLTWTAAANATGYHVHMRNVTAGEAFRKLPFPVSGTSWTAGSLVNGATYEFKLQSASGLIEGATSATVSVRPTGPAPSAPTGFTVQAGDRKAILTWNMPTGATSVYIHVKNVSAGETVFTKLPYPVADDSWTASGLVNGATYQYKVQAYNDLIAGSTSVTVSVVPQGPPTQGPESLYAVPGNQKVTLRWSGASRATGYDIWIREVTFGGSWKKLPYTVSDDTFTAGLLVNGATYEFRVQSKDGLQAGGYSNTVSAVPLGPTPQVSFLSVIGRSNGTADLEWNGHSTSSGYYIQMRNVSRGESFQELPYAVSGTSFTARYLFPGETYEFRVQAVNGLQRGVMTPGEQETMPLPNPVSSLSTSAGIFSVSLSWKPFSGQSADGYNIYYMRTPDCSRPIFYSRSQLTWAGYVTGTHHTFNYLFDPGCHWFEVVPTLYGKEAAFFQSGPRGTFTYKGHNDDSDLYEATLTYMYKEMYNNARSSAAASIATMNDLAWLSPIEKLNAYAAWGWLVRPGGVWDHKPPIARVFGPGREDGYKSYRYRIPGLPYEVYYDVWSNIHYGYVGRRAKFTEWELQTGAAPVGVQDDGDVRSIGIGASLWNSHGYGLSRQNIDSAIRANWLGYLGEDKVHPWEFSLVPNL